MKMLCKTINLLVTYLLFIRLSYEIDSCIYEVKNVNEFIDILRQINYEDKIQAQLTNWEEEIKEDPLYFEDPVTNFLFLKFLIIDVETELVSARLQKSSKRTVTIPPLGKLKKSAVLLNEMMSLYNIPIQQVITIILGVIFTKSRIKRAGKWNPKDAYCILVL